MKRVICPNYRLGTNDILSTALSSEEKLESGQPPHTPCSLKLKYSEMGNGALHIVPESSLVLYQREFMRGDIVKRSLTKVESALVVDSHSEVILQHVVTKQRIKKWVPYERLRNSLVVEARDRVVYDEWLGTIEEVR